MHEAYRQSISMNPAFTGFFKSITKEDIFHIVDGPLTIISDDAVAESGYIRRERFESELDACLNSDNQVTCTLVIGPEGVGKTTTTAYVIGHVLPKKYIDWVSASIFRIDCRTWHSEEYIVKRIYLELMDVLRSRINSKIRSSYVEFRNRLLLDGVDVPELETLDTREFVIRLLAYAICSNDRNCEASRFILVFDNLDTMMFSDQISTFAAVHDMIADIKKRGHNYKISGDDEIIRKINIIIPLRPETHHVICNTRGAFWPIQNDTYLLASALNNTKYFSRSDIPHSMELSKERIKIAKWFKSDIIGALTSEIRSVYNAKGGQTATGFTLTLPESRDIIIELVEWLWNGTKHLDHILSFCGGSIRRALYLAFKVIGHPSIMRAFIEHKYLHMESRQIEHLVWDALWDFCQPVGHQSLVPRESLIINPFGFIRDIRLRAESPEIGAQVFMYINKLCTHKTGDDAYTDLKISEIIDYLTQMGYRRDAILMCIRGLSTAGIMHPLRINGSSDIPDDYKIDRSLFQNYFRLISFDSRKNQWKASIFLTHCYRDIFSKKAFVPYGVVSERLHMQADFLEEIIRVENNLRSLIRQTCAKPESIRRPSFVHLIGTKWLRYMTGISDDICAPPDHVKEELDRLRYRIDFIQREIKDVREFLI